MIIFICGEDTFRSKQKLKALRQKFTEEIDGSQINIDVLDGEKLDSETFKQAMASGGFLVKKRMAIIENFIEKNKNKQAIKEILDLAKKQSVDSIQENIIIFWEALGSISADKYRGKKLSGPLLKYLKTIKYSYEFPLLSKNELLAWVKNRVSIGDDAANLLVEFIGSDLWRMNNEINKLKAYKNNQNLTIADVKLLAEEKFDQKIFDLTDAAANKNRKQFIKLADEYLSSDVEPAYILTFLIRQFRMMARAKSLLGKNPTVNLALEIKIHPFVAQK
ncbi:hypothetical protein KAS41_02620, partial [Candidatus Parcubacteria bacterium]|nr:hypothetical protein [Candidatus Parcubacteria bacterium]